jgi:hypothetical protein
MAFIQAGSVVFAIIGYIIWPHVFRTHTARMVLEGILESPGAYFMRLDPIVLIGTLLQVPVYLGLFAVLQTVDRPIAVVALTISMVSAVSVVSTRPIIELFVLADQYASAQSPDEVAQYLGAAEMALAQCHGTAWATSVMCGGLGAVLFGWIMRRTPNFRPATSLFMIISGVGALLVLVPVIGIIALFALATVGGIVASILYGLDLLRYGN